MLKKTLTFLLDAVKAVESFSFVRVASVTGPRASVPFVFGKSAAKPAVPPSATKSVSSKSTLTFNENFKLASSGIDASKLHLVSLAKDYAGVPIDEDGYPDNSKESRWNNEELFRGLADGFQPKTGSATKEVGNALIKAFYYEGKPLAGLILGEIPPKRPSPGVSLGNSGVNSHRYLQSAVIGFVFGIVAYAAGCYFGGSHYVWMAAVVEVAPLALLTVV